MDIQCGEAHRAMAQGTVRHSSSHCLGPSHLVIWVIELSARQRLVSKSLGMPVTHTLEHFGDWRVGLPERQQQLIVLTKLTNHHAQRAIDRRSNAPSPILFEEYARSYKSFHVFCRSWKHHISRGHVDRVRFPLLDQGLRFCVAEDRETWPTSWLKGAGDVNEDHKHHVGERRHQDWDGEVEGALELV